VKQEMTIARKHRVPSMHFAFLFQTTSRQCSGIGFRSVGTQQILDFVGYHHLIKAGSLSVWFKSGQSHGLIVLPVTMRSLINALHE